MSFDNALALPPRAKKRTGLSWTVTIESNLNAGIWRIIRAGVQFVGEGRLGPPAIIKLLLVAPMPVSH